VHLNLHNLLSQLAGSLGILSYRDRAFSLCFKRSLRSGLGNKTPQRCPPRTTPHTVVLSIINLTSQHLLFYLLSVCIPSHDNILSSCKVFVCIHLNIIFHGSLLLCPALRFLCHLLFLILCLHFSLLSECIIIVVLFWYPYLCGEFLAFYVHYKRSFRTELLQLYLKCAVYLLELPRGSVN